MPRYGYIRLDKRDPDVARQAAQLDRIGGFDKIFVEQKKGDFSLDLVPEQLNRAIGMLQKGDLLFISSLDRFCCTSKEFLERVDEITAKNADLICLEENFDTRSPSAKNMVKMIKTLEQLDRSTMSARKKQGIKAARDEGRQIGRPPVSIPVGFRTICREWAEGTITGVEAIRRSGMKSTSFYKKAAELGYERNK